jgi:hypothetical protein
MADGDVRRVVEAVVAWALAAISPEYLREDVEVRVRAGGRTLLETTIHPSQLGGGPAPPGPPAPRQSAAFEPTDYQVRILEALEFRALRTDALAAALEGDRRRLFRRPGGLHDLREAGLIALDPRRGYYRPDAAPDGVGEDA